MLLHNLLLYRYDLIHTNESSKEALEEMNNLCKELNKILESNEYLSLVHESKVVLLKYLLELTTP